MARITTYELDAAINDADKLIGTDADDNNQTKNFSLLGIAEYVIDTFIDPDASDFQIPVFNQNGIRITGSIMSQDSSPSNGVAGTKITIAGDLTLERDQSDTTLTLVSDTSNIGEQNNPSIKFIQDGGAQNAAVGFNIIDDTAGGTLPNTGNRFWIVNAINDSTGEGGITFGTAQVNGWENAIGRFIIRGDGKGLFGHPNANYTKTLDSQFEIYDDRTENNTSDYSLSVLGVADISDPGGSGGAGGIISRINIVNGATPISSHAIGMVTGLNSSEILTTGDLAFFVGSDMDTSSATGFAGLIHDSGNWQIGGVAAGDADPGYKLYVAGSTNITDDVQIDTLTNNYIPIKNNEGVLRDSGFYQVFTPSPGEKAIGLNTTILDTNYGEYPDFRVASRQDNDLAVLDLFRRDNTVLAGENVGMLQYSVQDDGRYAVAQMAVQTLSASGSGDSGGGKFLFKTAEGGSSGGSYNTPESRFTLDYNSADFLVPTTFGSSTLMNASLTVEGVSTFNDDIEVNNNAAFYSSTTFEDDANFQGSISDGAAVPGTPGQVLSSTGAEVRWIDNFVLTSPGGTDYRIVVDDAGVLSTVEV